MGGEWGGICHRKDLSKSSEKPAILPDSVARLLGFCRESPAVLLLAAPCSKGYDRRSSPFFVCRRTHPMCLRCLFLLITPYYFSDDLRSKEEIGRMTNHSIDDNVCSESIFEHTQ